MEGWFLANKTLLGAKNYTYSEFPMAFTWKADECRWKMRESDNVAGRMCDVHASASDTFFLRLLLMQIKGVTSYKDLWTVNGRVYGSFKEACDAPGLLRNDNQWHAAMSKNAINAMPRQLQELFVQAGGTTVAQIVRKKWLFRMASTSVLVPKSPTCCCEKVAPLHCLGLIIFFAFILMIVAFFICFHVLNFQIYLQRPTTLFTWIEL